MITATESYAYISKPADGPARLVNTPRVRVSQIIAAVLTHGWSVPELCRQYPYLTPAEAHMAMAYYYDHRQEIEAEIEEDDRLGRELDERTPESPFLKRMKAEGRL
jgi:uncharacterized protein (DUF433 family)